MKATLKPTIALSVLTLLFTLPSTHATLGTTANRAKTTERGPELEKANPEKPEAQPAKDTPEPKAQSAKPNDGKKAAADKQAAEVSEDEKQAAEEKLVTEKIVSALKSCQSLTKKIQTLEEMKVLEYTTKLDKDSDIRISFGTDAINDGGLCSHIDVEKVNEKAKTTDLVCCIVVTFDKGGDTHIKLQTTLEEEQQAVEIRLTKTSHRADIIAACPRAIRHKMTVPRLVTVLSDELESANDSLDNIVKGHRNKAKAEKAKDIPDQPQFEEDQGEPKKEFLKKEKYRKSAPRRSDPNKTA